MRWFPVAVMVVLSLAACNGSGSGPTDESGTRPVSGKPADPEAERLCMEGEALVTSEPEKAIEMLTRSIEKGESARAYLARARAKLQIATMITPGEIPEEIAPDLEKAIALAPAYTSSLLFKAERLGLMTSGGKEILWEILDRPVAEDDGVGFKVRARARASLADSLAATVLRGEPDMLGGHFQQEEADADYGRAAKLLPEDAELHLRWGYLLVSRMGTWKKGALKRGAEVLGTCVTLDAGGVSGREAQRLLDEM